MRKHFKHYFIILAVVLSIIVAQNLFADTAVQTVTGVIESISTAPNSIVVDGTEIYGIILNSPRLGRIRTLSNTACPPFLPYHHLLFKRQNEKLPHDVVIGNLTQATIVVQG